jgi:hypothetical protein
MMKGPGLAPDYRLNDEFVRLEQLNVCLMILD